MNNFERLILMIYRISDIHGDFIRYQTILKMINFSDADTLYVLGNIIDYGDESMKILFDMMKRNNVVPLLGNHEYMALKNLSLFSKDASVDSYMKMSSEDIVLFKNWVGNGGDSTIKEYRKLSNEEQKIILDYLSKFSLYKEVTVSGKDFVLVHAGINNFDENKSMAEYQKEDLIFNSPDYSKVYFKDKYLVTGHTPTWKIRYENKSNPVDLVYINNNHIAINCGVNCGGLLGAIRFDDFEDFYC